MQNSGPYLKDKAGLSLRSVFQECSHVPFICENVQKSILPFTNVYKVNYIGLWTKIC